MDTRKPYTTPAIAAKGVLEQTSLACNATQGVPVGPAGGASAVWPACAFAGVQETFGSGCATDVTKGGAFVENDPFCSVWFDYPEGIVVLS